MLGHHHSSLCSSVPPEFPQPPRHSTAPAELSTAQVCCCDAQHPTAGSQGPSCTSPGSIAAMTRSRIPAEPQLPQPNAQPSTWELRRPDLSKSASLVPRPSGPLGVRSSRPRSGFPPSATRAGHGSPPGWCRCSSTHGPKETPGLYIKTTDVSAHARGRGGSPCPGHDSHFQRIKNKPSTDTQHMPGRAPGAGPALAHHSESGREGLQPPLLPSA